MSGTQSVCFWRRWGFVEEVAIRRTNEFVGIQLKLLPSVERELMIRKLFTAGRDNNTVVETSALAPTGAILKSIWATSSALPEMSLAVGETGFAEKLPPRVFWSDLAKRRPIQ